MTISIKPPERVIIRAKDFRKLTGIPDSTRADWENPASPRYKPDFPMKIRMGARSVGYFLDEVLAWLESRKDNKGSPDAEKAPQG